MNLICRREVSAVVFFDEPQSRAKSRYWFCTTSSLDNFRLVDHSGVGIVNRHKPVSRYLSGETSHKRTSGSKCFRSARQPPRMTNHITISSIKNLAIMRQLTLKMNLRWTSSHETPEANSSAAT